MSSEQVDATVAYSNLVAHYSQAVRYIGTHREMQADLWHVFINSNRWPIDHRSYPMMVTP